MNFISVRNSETSAQELIAGITGFIHRKDKGEYVRFNPAFKQFIGERGIGYTANNGKIFLAVGDYAWKMAQSANMKASTFTNLIDSIYDVDTNRYDLKFVESNKHGDVFEIVPAEPVKENRRPITEEQKQQLIEQLAKARAEKNKEKENELQTTLEFGEEEIEQESNTVEQPVTIG